jgi:ribosome maturation factor RimP
MKSTSGPAFEKRERIKSRQVVSRVWALIEPICATEGLELVHVEFRGEPGGRILRLYMDKPGGILLDDCVHISRQVDDLLEIHLDEIGSFRLEVSSPGLERPLGKEDDFEKFSGSGVKIKTAEPIDGRRNFTGVLGGISGGIVTMLVEEKTISIPFQDIIRARLVIA